MDNRSLGIIHDTTELRKLIAENPDLPIAIMVGQEAASDEYSYTYCTDVRCHVGEILDCTVPCSDTVITDREDLKDCIDNSLDEYWELPDAKYDEIVANKLAEYEPYWKQAIIVIADN